MTSKLKLIETNEINLSYSFFLILDLYSLIPESIIQILNPTVELAIHKRIPTKEAKADHEMHPITVEAKKSKC